MYLLNLWRQRIDLKVIGTTLFLLGIILGVSAWHTIDTERQVLLDQINAHGNSLANASSVFSIEPLLSMDYPVLETYAENLVVEALNVGFAHFYDSDGNLVAQAPQPQIQETFAKHSIRTYTAKVKINKNNLEPIGTVVIGMLTHRSTKLINVRIRQLTLYTLISFIVLSLSLSFLLRRVVTNPVRHLDSLAKSLGTGQLDTIIKIPGNDELAHLAATLDTMRNNLNLSYTEIRRQNDELKRLDQMKDEFLANVTHEFKTPINGILGLGNAIHDGAYGTVPDLFDKPIKQVIISAHRLLKMTLQILDLSPEKANNLTKQKIHVLPSIKKIIEQFERQCVDQNNTYGCQIDPDLLLNADSTHFHNIFVNLIGNAIKFTHSGHIKVIAEPLTQVAIVFSVEDTGIGIPPEMHTAVFERFQQGFASENRAYEGSGLGLAIMKQALTALNGAVHLHSIPGKGSIFTALLPIVDGLSQDELLSLWHSSQDNVETDPAYSRFLASLKD